MTNRSPLATLLIQLARKGAQFVARFLKNMPANPAEQRLFFHANGVADTLLNTYGNRTMRPLLTVVR